MYRLARTIIPSIALLAWCGSAWAIDCKHARLPAQQVACSSPELLKILDARDRAFAQARARLKGKELASLIADERDWVRDYPKSCGVAAKGSLPNPIPKATIACFKRASEARITYLRQYGRPKSAAAPESTATPAAPSEGTAAPSPPAPSKAEPAAAPAAAEQPATPPPAAPAPPPAARSAAGPTQPAPASASATAQYHLKFTFACGNAGELPKVLSSLAANDLSYPLSRPDCLPVPDGGKANLLSVSGNIAKIRMCTADVGCTDVYIDANSVLDADGRPAAK